MDKFDGNVDFDKVPNVSPKKLEVKVENEDTPYDLRDSNTIPFQTEWSFGVDVVTKVFNLTRHKDDRKIFCGATHVGVIYDHKQHDMRFLLGHSNYISCISSDASGRWLVTVGSADDNTVIVWDSEGCFPVSTLFDSHPDDGICRACISHDAKFLVTVGAGTDPSIKFWQWTLGKIEQDDVYVANNAGPVRDVCFNQNKSEHFMVTFAEDVLFCTWKDEKLQVTPPNMHDKCASNYGNFTVSTYIESAHICLTATDEGFVIIWGSTFVSKPFDSTSIDNKKMFIKAIRLQKNEITSITSVDGVIATGDVQGNIKFYDHRMQLLYWCKNFSFPSIQAISFNLEKRHYIIDDNWPVHSTPSTIEETIKQGDEDRSEEYERLYVNMVPSDFSLQRAPFIVRDFVILGRNGLLGYVDFLENTLDILLPNTSTAITSIALHDEKPILCIGYANGNISTYNYQTHQLTVNQTITTGKEIHSAITSICFSNGGLHLVCGTSGGYLWFLHPAILEPNQGKPFFFDNSEILSIRFSSDNNYLVYYDSSAGVSLLKCDQGSAKSNPDWIFHGRYIAHHQSITDMLFINEDTRLFTLGRDRHIVEYDVLESKPKKFDLVSRECIMQTGVPQSFIVYNVRNDGLYFLIATNEYKYILVSTKSYETDRTVLAPVLCVPVQKFSIIPSTNAKYLLFSTKKYLGIQRLPVTGNPCEHVAMVGHPEYISDFHLSPDGKYAFTIGKNDNICFMWKLNINATDILAHRGGRDLKPYICLIEGGLTGWLFQEMQDLFYYMQILHQGENSALPRNASSKIPTAELPNFMRAIGFYPTEYALQNMLYEVNKYYAVPSNEDQEDKVEDEISFDNVLKLYVNHRPALGVQMDQLKVAFNRFADNGKMKGKEFVEMLCNKGEKFTPTALSHCLKVLMHQARGGNMKDCKNPDQLLPEEFEFNTFANDILGLDMPEQT